MKRPLYYNTKSRKLTILVLLTIFSLSLTNCTRCSSESPSRFDGESDEKLKEAIDMSAPDKDVDSENEYLPPDEGEDNSGVDEEGAPQNEPEEPTDESVESGLPDNTDEPAPDSSDSTSDSEDSPVEE